MILGHLFQGPLSMILPYGYSKVQRLHKCIQFFISYLFCTILWHFRGESYTIFVAGHKFINPLVSAARCIIIMLIMLANEKGDQK